MANVTNIIIKPFDDLIIKVVPFEDVRVIVPADEEEEQPTGIFDNSFDFTYE